MQMPDADEIAVQTGKCIAQCYAFAWWDQSGFVAPGKRIAFRYAFGCSSHPIDATGDHQANA